MSDPIIIPVKPGDPHPTVEITTEIAVQIVAKALTTVHQPSSVTRSTDEPAQDEEVENAPDFAQIPAVYCRQIMAERDAAYSVLKDALHLLENYSAYNQDHRQDVVDKIRECVK
jgi:hypothetical protein